MTSALHFFRTAAPHISPISSNPAPPSPPRQLEPKLLRNGFRALINLESKRLRYHDQLARPTGEPSLHPHGRWPLESIGYDNPPWCNSSHHLPVPALGMPLGMSAPRGDGDLSHRWEIYHTVEPPTHLAHDAWWPTPAIRSASPPQFASDSRFRWVEGGSATLDLYRAEGKPSSRVLGRAEPSRA